MASCTYQLDTRIRRRHVPLETQQHRLRHLRSIAARNIILHSSVKMGHYFTLHLNCSSQAFYTSEVISDCPNPTWKSFEMSSFPDYVPSGYPGVVVRVWSERSEGDNTRVECIIEWLVFFKSLIYLGEQVPKEGKKVKATTLLFGMTEGFYGSSDGAQFQVADEAEVLKDTIPVDPSTIRMTYSVNTLSRIQIMHRAIKQTQALVRRVQASIQDKIHVSGKQHRSHLVEREQLKLKVATLQNELHSQMVVLKHLKEQRDAQEAEVQHEAGSLNQRVQMPQREREKLADKRKHYFEARENLLKTTAQLMLRRKQLISEVVSYIYPIVEFPDKKGCSICKVYLPNSEDFAGHDEVMLSVALGYVCHVTQMIAHFLNVPLRYPVHHFGSHSSVQDHIQDKIPDKEREFPLYSKGKDKMHFHYAVYLLNKNIAQLRHYCALTTHDLRATLSNLHSLIEMRLSLRSDPLAFHPSPSDAFIKVPASSSSLINVPSFPSLSSLDPNRNFLQQPEALPSDGKSRILGGVDKDETRSTGKLNSAEMMESLRVEMESASTTPAHGKLPLLAPKLGNDGVLSCSLDKGLNEIKLMQQSVSTFAGAKIRDVPKLRMQKVRSLSQGVGGHHGSVPNLSDCSPRLSLDDAAFLSDVKWTRFGARLKLWTAENSQGNSDDEQASVPSGSRTPMSVFGADRASSNAVSDDGPWTPDRRRPELLPHCDGSVCSCCEADDGLGGAAKLESDFDAQLQLRTEILANRSGSFRLQTNSSHSPRLSSILTDANCI